MLRPVALLCLCLVAVIGDVLDHVYTLSAADKQALVDVHNKYRNLLGFTNYPQVRWNDTLAAFADLGTQRCEFEHASEWTETEYGENIYKATNIDEVSGTQLLERASNRWASEKEFVDIPDWKCSVTFKFPEVPSCGHYSAMIWNTSTEVGCSVSKCHDGTDQDYYVFCEYFERGNKALRVGYDEEGNRLYEPRKPY